MPQTGQLGWSKPILKDNIKTNLKDVNNTGCSMILPITTDSHEDVLYKNGEIQLAKGLPPSSGLCSKQLSYTTRNSTANVIRSCSAHYTYCALSRQKTCLESTAVRPSGHSAPTHVVHFFVSPSYSLHSKCKHKTWQPSWNVRHHLNSRESSHQWLLCQTLHNVFILILLLAA
jgi:hypothetical protein